MAATWQASSFVVQSSAETVDHSHLPSCFAFLAGSSMSPASADKARLLLQAGQCGQKHRAAAADWNAMFGPTALDSPALFAALHKAFCLQDIMSFSHLELLWSKGPLPAVQDPGQHVYACVVMINVGDCVLLVVLV